MAIFMTREEGISWDRCSFFPGMKLPTRADFDRFNRVKKRAGNNKAIFYQFGARVSYRDAGLHILRDAKLSRHAIWKIVR